MRTEAIGKNNPRLTDIRKALRSGGLTSDGLLPVEGYKLIQEAIASGLEATDLYVRADEDGAALPAGRTHRVEAAVFKTIRGTESSQGVLALVRPRSFRFEDLVAGPAPLVVVLAGLQDPGNVGTILRAAEAFNASGCVAFEGTASLYNQKTVRATAGSLFRLPHIWNVPGEEAMRRLRSAGLQIIGTGPEGSRAPENVDWKAGTALLVGNEGGGLTAEEKAGCDILIGIRQNPAVDSLNSAISAAVVLYEASRQRGRQQ